MTTKEIALTICEKIQNEYPKRPIWQTMLEIENLIDKHVKKQLSIQGVSNWVAIESNEQPEIMTDVMVKYKDGRKEVAYFDGDKRFYIEKDDRDITEIIVEWHKLP